MWVGVVCSVGVACGRGCGDAMVVFARWRVSGRGPLRYRRSGGFSGGPVKVQGIRGCAGSR